MPIVTKFPSAVSVTDTWAGTTNIYVDNGTYASTGGTRNGNADIVGSSFGFAIPSGATINSVLVEVEYKLSTTASASTLTLQAQYNGSLMGTASTTTSEPTTDTIWNTSNTGSWTAEELNSDLLEVLFRVRRTSNTACTYSVDYLSVTVDYTEQAENYNLIGAVSQSSTVEVLNTKQASLVGAISQSSSVSSGNVKEVSLVGEISQSSTVVSSLTKQEQTNDYNLVGSISQSSEVSSVLSKQVNQVAEISQGSVVYSTLIKDGEVSYDYNLTGEISQPSTVESSLRKENQIIGSISQSSIVSSVNGKQTYIFGNIEQLNSVSSLASKQVNQELSIEQLSELYSSLTRYEFTEERIAPTDIKTVYLDGRFRGESNLNNVDRKIIMFNKSGGTVKIKPSDRKVVSTDD